MFNLFIFQWFYAPRESSLGGLTGGDIEEDIEETKDERDDYDELYDEQMNLNHSLVFP